MMTYMHRILVGFTLAFGIAYPAEAQVLYGSLTGTVRDVAGAIVPGAAANATNTRTGQEFTTQTNDVGTYSRIVGAPPQEGTVLMKFNIEGRALLIMFPQHTTGARR